MRNYLHEGMLLYLDKLVDWDAYYRGTKGEGVDVQAEVGALRSILETAAEICAAHEPVARERWAETARLQNGEVVLPSHIQATYDKLREAGLTTLTVSEKYGGFGLPMLIVQMYMQMLSRADMGLQPVIALQAGVAADIEAFANEAVCEQYLPRMVSGEWQGAMDLTEPQAGSDLGAITTRATERNGRCFIDGQKIFITNGCAHVHLVLARDDDTFEQSKGTTRGMSLYVVPRRKADGSPNGVSIERLEHKLGLHGSATCAMRYENAEGLRIAKKGEGFKAMLSLMNHARQGVAAQGIGIAEAALQQAIEYSRTRVQFGQPIGEQPLMKNMLARMVLLIESSRALTYRCTRVEDQLRAIETQLEREGASLPDAERSDLERLAEQHNATKRLLTPLCKFVATESCDEVTRMAIQVHGGIGFMAETAVGKLHLDGIITTIYEGTSEIQVSFALKEIGKGALEVVFDELRRDLSKLTSEPLAGLAAKVHEGIERIVDCTPALLQGFNYALLCSRLMAEMVSHVIIAAELLQQAAVEPSRVDLAASWIHRKMLDLEVQARRVSEGTLERLDRCERVVRLWG